MEDFKKKVGTNRLVKFWNNLDELPGLVALSLSKTIKTYPAIGWIRADMSADPSLYKLLSELQSENRELKELSLEQENGEQDNLETLADLDDQIKVSGTHKRWDNYQKRDINISWEIIVTWNQMFSLVSPYLIEHPSDGTAKSTLSKVLYEITPDASSKGTATINDQDYQTIKIHLKAIGLTDIRYTKTTKGGMGLFWYLTKRGEQLMLKLRSVKK